MKRLLAVAALILSGSTGFGQESDLVERARRAIAYWHSLFLQCGSGQNQGAPWYGVAVEGPIRGSIQMVPELRINLKTEEFSQEQRLNGFEFKATTSLDPGPFRWWIAQNKAWRDWQVGEIAPPRSFIKKKGVWSDEPPRREDIIGSKGAERVFGRTSDARQTLSRVPGKRKDPRRAVDTSEIC